MPGARPGMTGRGSLAGLELARQRQHLRALGIAVEFEFFDLRRAFLDAVRSATTRASQTRAPLKDNEGFGVLGWVNGEEVKGDRRWWITKSYSRIHVSGTKEKPKAVESAETKDGERAFGVIIYDGVAYYPALQEGKPRDLVVVTAKANLRESASTDAKAIGTVKKDDKLVAAYWCFGPKPEGHDESVWWILTTDGDGNVVDNPIEKGARLWIEATNSRPD